MTPSLYQIIITCLHDLIQYLNMSLKWHFILIFYLMYFHNIHPIKYQNTYCFSFSWCDLYEDLHHLGFLMIWIFISYTVRGSIITLQSPNDNRWLHRSVYLCLSLSHDIMNIMWNRIVSFSHYIHFLVSQVNYIYITTLVILCTI